MAHVLYDLSEKESHYMLMHGWQISRRYMNMCQHSYLSRSGVEVRYGENGFCVSFFIILNLALNNL